MTHLTKSPATSSGEQATVHATAKKSTSIKEDEFTSFINGRPYVEISKTLAEKQWDGTPLKKDVVYHESQLGGLPIYGIEANRRTFRRAVKMLNACHDKGMTTPAVLVRAELVRDWNLKLVDLATHEIVPEEKISGAYSIMEGHGRHYASLLDKALAAKDISYKPFDFKFVFEDYGSAEEFGAAYLSTNEDMTRTTNKDRLKIAGARCRNPLVKRFNSLCKEGAIAKAVYFWVYGRELSATEANDITKDLSSAPKFDVTLTDALAKVYEAFKKKFGAKGAEKIYRGVAAAKWSATQISAAQDKIKTADVICEKVNAMNNDIYTEILTAKSDSKKHLVREQVITNLLDKMLK